MAVLTIEISNAMAQFIDDQIASRGFEDRGEFVRVTLALRMLEAEGKDSECDCFMFHGKPVMTREQESRFERSLLIAQEEFERGECSIHEPGESRRSFAQLLRQRKEIANEDNFVRTSSGSPVPE